MSNNSLCMSLDEIIKSKKSKPGRGGSKPGLGGSQIRRGGSQVGRGGPQIGRGGPQIGRGGSKIGRGGSKPGFRNVAKKQVLKGVAANGPRKSRQGAFNTRNISAGNTFRGGRGSMRGRNNRVNRAFTAQTTIDRLQFKRLNNKLNIINLKNRQRLGHRNVQVPARIEQRNKRFAGGNGNTSVRYFNQRSRNVWKTKGNFAGSTLKKVRNPKLKGKRIIQTLARQKVQKARLVLTNRNSIGRRQTKIVRSAVPVAQQKGIRRSKFGFVTVRNRNEKRLEQLTTAVPSRNRITNRSAAWQGTSSEAVSIRSRNRPRGGRGGRGRSQVSVSNNLVQVRIPNDFRPQFSVQNTAAPLQTYGGYPGNSSAYPSSNYPIDHHEMAMHEMMWPAQHQRHTVVRPADCNEFEMSRGTLDPEIQRKISFIQSRASGQSYNVLPDFKAPVSTSQMKLSERFRMFMH